MSEKYFNIDIDDPRASKIAEVMSNKTSKRILSLIAEKELTASEIAAELDLPLNTVGYHIEKLLEAGLIEKSKNFFWSIKGKKMPTYRLSNKKILISPKKLIPQVPIAVLGVILMIAFLYLIYGLYGRQITIEGNETKSDLFKTFNSQEELVKYIKDNKAGLEARGLYSEMSTTSEASVSNAAPKSSSEYSAGSGDYSKTNIQVEGVDEPDIVKTDGKYIYLLSKGKLIIVEASPAEDMKEVSNITAEYARNMFVNGDKLVIFKAGYKWVSYSKDSESEETTEKGSAVNIAPYCYDCNDYETRGAYVPLTYVYVYNIEDRKNPLIEKNISFEGKYIDARMIDNYVYLITSKSTYYGFLPPSYTLNGAEIKSEAKNVFYYPNYEDSDFSFTFISSINLNSDEIKNKIYLTGYTGSIYASKDNIYLTYLKRISYKEYNERLVKEVFLPLVSEEIKEKIKVISDSNISVNEKNYQIRKEIYTYTDALADEEKEKFFKNIYEKMSDFEKKMSKESEKTVIAKVKIKEGDVELQGTGEVFGRLLNQFSMDEFEENLRVATTTGEVWAGNSVNHMFVLDKNMKLIGSVQDMAPGEEIYSVRFMGKRAYVVTFKKIDPFFVIDLSNPAEPKVLGYLKIPGFSNYLHPYDENHIIGIGKDTAEPSEEELKKRNIDFAWYQGIKISLFDVSDVEHPIEEAKYIIGDRGTDSPLLYDHKSLLFSKEKNLLAFPVVLYEINRSKYKICSEEEKKELGYNAYQYCLSTNTYGELTFQGFYVFDINNKGIELRGRVTHFEEKNLPKKASEEPIGAERIINGVTWKKVGINTWEANSADYYIENKVNDALIDYSKGGYVYEKIYDSSKYIERGVYIKNVLYTISQSKIKANWLDSLGEIKEVDLV